jgi:PPP family 3-phenylpropionic acid transporter
MGALYVAALLGTGVSTPFISLWFSAHGLKGAEISLVLAAPMLARWATSPLLAIWADGFRLRRTALVFLALAAALAYALMAVTRGLGPWMALWFVAATAINCLIPLADVITLKRAARDGFPFGLPRGAGSLAFLVANAAMGAILTVAGVDVIPIWIVLAAVATALAAQLAAPDEPVHEATADEAAGQAPQGRFQALLTLGRNGPFVTAIVAGGLIQAAHAFYYAFSNLVWKAQGVPDVYWGLLWATGVAAEITFLALMAPLRRRLGDWNLLMLGGAGAAVRWTAYAFAPPLWLLWPLQALHALSFAAAYFAGLHIVDRLSPARSKTLAQTLNSALSSGVLIGLATIAAGPLFDRFGARGYLAMTALAGLGLLAGLRLRPALHDGR